MLKWFLRNAETANFDFVMVTKFGEFVMVSWAIFAVSLLSWVLFAVHILSLGRSSLFLFSLGCSSLFISACRRTFVFDALADLPSFLVCSRANPVRRHRPVGASAVFAGFTPFAGASL